MCLDEEEEDAAGESYDNIEGAYNPKDYASLNVSSEVRDLFQYIDRYKPQEMELETTLKCFIPEYIPAIGEMDAFIKVRQMHALCYHGYGTLLSLQQAASTPSIY